MDFLIDGVKVDSVFLDGVPVDELQLDGVKVFPSNSVDFSGIPDTLETSSGVDNTISYAIKFAGEHEYRYTPDPAITILPLWTTDDSTLYEYEMVKLSGNAAIAGPTGFVTGSQTWIVGSQAGEVATAVGEISARLIGTTEILEVKEIEFIHTVVDYTLISGNRSDTSGTYVGFSITAYNGGGANNGQLVPLITQYGTCVYLEIHKQASFGAMSMSLKIDESLPFPSNPSFDNVIVTIADIAHTLTWSGFLPSIVSWSISQDADGSLEALFDYLTGREGIDTLIIID